MGGEGRGWEGRGGGGRGGEGVGGEGRGWEGRGGGGRGGEGVGGEGRGWEGRGWEGKASDLNFKLNIPSASVNITLATVFHSAVIDFYVCQVVAFPLPVEISWTGEDARGNNISLSDDIAGVEILSSVEGNETISRLSVSSGVSSVACTATNGDYPGVTQWEFQILDGTCVTLGLPFS